jgi:hypothetical protein
MPDQRPSIGIRWHRRLDTIQRVAVVTAGVITFVCSAALLATGRLGEWLSLASNADTGIGLFAAASAAVAVLLAPVVIAAVWLYRRWQERRWAALARRRKR